MAEPPARSQIKQELRERQQRWLQEVVKATGLKPSQIADKAGVSDTTLTRLLNNPEYTGTLSQITIDRIRETFHLPGPEDYGGKGRFSLNGFADAERFVPADATVAIARAVDALIDGRNGVDAWRLRTDALAQAGYLPGDIVLVDLNGDPKPQDAVCAQVYDWSRGKAETIFRIWDPPFLVAAAHDRTAYKPLTVDHDRIMIKGVVLEAVRPHRLSATR